MLFLIDPVETFELDKKILSNRDLIIPKFFLTESKWLASLKITIKTQESDSKQYSQNGYMVHIKMKITNKWNTFFLIDLLYIFLSVFSE